MRQEKRDFKNESKEFLLVRAGENPAGELMKEENVELRLPPELLADAKIPMDADLDIVCTDRKIVILPHRRWWQEKCRRNFLVSVKNLESRRKKVNIVLRMTEEGRDEKPVYKVLDEKRQGADTS